MEIEEWLTAAKKLALSQGQQGPRAMGSRELEPDALAIVLAQLDRLVRSAPQGLLKIFQRCEEAELEVGTARRADEIDRGRLGWTATSHDEPESWLVGAVEQARAIDETLALAPDLGADGVGAWTLLEQGVHVIPRRSRLVDGSQPKVDEPYARRGLLHHAVLPCRLGDRQIKLFQVKGGPLKPNAAKPAVLGAAMFAGAKVNLRPLTGRGYAQRRFLVESFEADALNATLLAQVRAAFDDHCIAAVWPELTVPPDAKLAISESFGALAVEMGAGKPLKLSVAGSWHIGENDAERRNRATILDRRGDELFHYDKAVPYWDQENGVEAIVPGSDLPIVVTDDLLIAFATCLDFCDQAEDNPYYQLPVDLLLVLSMGGPTTTTSHVENARLLRRRNGTEAFVVQQAYPRQDDRLGDVIYSTKGMLAAVPQSATWKAYSVEKA